MTKRTAKYFFTLAANANLALLPPNPHRTYLLISAPAAAAWYVSFGSNTGANSEGIRIAPAQSPLEFKREFLGQTIEEQVNMWNAGSAGVTVFVLEGLS